MKIQINTKEIQKVESIKEDNHNSEFNGREKEGILLFYRKSVCCER